MSNKALNLIFLHGLLGTKADWVPLIQELQCQQPELNCFALDLPYHGERKQIEVQGFDECCEDLHKQIQQVIGNAPFVLVGYSLGGRIALYYALKWLVEDEHSSLKGLILEGANLGLTNEMERQARWKHDEFWATRFCSETTMNVLADWYKQPIFTHLTEMQRTALIRQREVNCGENIGKMLLATSLAKQPNFAPYLSAKLRSNSDTNFPLFYVVGEYDKKFRSLALNHQLPLLTIPNSGHNAHLENPNVFAILLKRQLLATFMS